MRLLPSRGVLDASRSTWVPATLGAAVLAIWAAAFAPWPDRPGVGGFRLFLFLLPICLVAAGLSAGLEIARPLRLPFERGLSRTIHLCLWVPTIIILVIAVYETLIPGTEGFTIETPDPGETVALLSFLLWPQYVGIPIAGAVIVAQRGTRRDGGRWLLLFVGAVLVWFFWANIFTQGDADRFATAPRFILAAAALSFPYYRLLRPAKKLVVPGQANPPIAPDSSPTFTSALSRPPPR